ncbi:MAG: helix-turn-helix domain-containing protein [Thermoplasmatota archaeon]
MEGSDKKIELSRDELQALLSESRLKILRRLRTRRMTVSELARRMDLDKSTVYNHLRYLLEANFVERIKGDNIWVYYQLTDRGVGVLRNRGKFLVLLGTSAVSLAAGLVQLVRYYLAAEPGTRDTGDPLTVLSGLLLLALAVVSGVLALRLRRHAA